MSVEADQVKVIDADTHLTERHDLWSSRVPAGMKDRMPHVAEVDGHDLEAITAAVRPDAAGPLVVVAKTKKGHGVSFMEDQFEWHYLPLSRESYQEAIEQTLAYA